MDKFLPQHWIVKIVITAILYYVGSVVGLQFTSSLSVASFFWPSAGLALACLFMFGPTAVIGIAIGSLATKIFLLEDLQILSLLSSFAAVFQAYVAYKVLKPLFESSFLLINEKAIFRFFTLNPIFTLISPTLSTLNLYILHTIDNEHIVTTWFTWWVGDTLGVLIITPLFFALFSKQKEWAHRRLSVGLSLLILAFISVQVFHFAQTREHQLISQRLLQTNQIFNTEISNTLKQYEKNLQAINIFFLSTYHATPTEINDFLSKLDLKKDEASYGYGWFGFADLINTKSDTQYAFYTLKKYHNPLQRKPIKVIQHQYDECAIGSYIETNNSDIQLPSTLYRNIEASISSIENLCASEHLGGVAYVDIDLNFLLQKIATELKINHLTIQLFGTNDNQTALLYKNKIVDYSASEASDYTPTAESLITYKNTFWNLKITGDSAYVEQFSTWSTWWLFIVSLVLTAFSGLSLLILTARKFQTESQVVTKTSELQHVNNQLIEQIQQQKQTQILIKMQSRILEMIAKDELLDNVLNQLCLYAENQVFEGAHASIITLNEKKQNLRLIAAPSMTASTKNYLSSLDYSDNKNPSVLALKTKKQQIFENIDASIAGQIDDIAAYWSTPIISHQNKVLGVFTLTHSSSRLPNAHEQQLMSVTAALACISFERHADNRQLNKLSNAVKSSPNGIVITSAKGEIEYTNPYFSDYIGIPDNELKGELLSRFVQDSSDSNSQEFDWDYSLSLGESQRDYMGIHPNGDTYWCRQTIAAMYDEKEDSHHVLSIHQDITDEYTAHQFIKQQASHDSLTGLYNRAEFEFQLDKLLALTYTGNHHSIAFIDLDKFKTVNDQCGHSAGDQLLRSISQLMESKLRRTDFLARIGGDEFAIIFEQCPAEKAEIILNELIQSVADYQFIWDGGSYRIGASAGLVEINEPVMTAEDILKNADTACYLAKEEGRQRVHLYQRGELEKQLDHIRQNWQETLNDALTNDHFLLYAQPILNLKSNAIDKYEILLRLRGENTEIIPPGGFLSEAERLNLMPKIDRWVITKSFKWIQDNPDKTFQIAINLSGQTLDNTFTPWLIQLIDKTKIDAKRLCFEITETVAIIDLQHTQDLINSLHLKGCTFALDDFGSGLSSFSYLKNLQVDYLKIDGQFVKDIEHDLIDRAMVKSINEIAHIVGKKTIAEFAENEAINNILKEIGVDYIQGYSIGKPTELNSI